MRLVLLLVSLLSQSGLGFQTEFVRSFIARPWMLTNRSLHDPTPDKSWNQATLSIYLDNWSPHNLKLAGDEIRYVNSKQKSKILFNLNFDVFVADLELSVKD